MNLIVEDGSAITNANSYASVDQGDAYHDAQLHSLVWTAASSPTKERALAMATRTLDAMATWQGTRATATQALGWPRESAVYDGLEVSADMVPTPVIQATCELARMLISADVTQDISQNDLSSLNLGKGALEVAFKSSSEKKRIPSIVEELLQGLGTLTGAAGSNRLSMVSTRRG